jgi:hypothetical protein
MNQPTELSTGGAAEAFNAAKPNQKTEISNAE